MTTLLTPKSLSKIFTKSDLSDLPLSNPGDGKPWIDLSGLLRSGAGVTGIIPYIPNPTPVDGIATAFDGLGGLKALGYTPSNDSLVVHLSGTETITGSKTFSSLLTGKTARFTGDDYDSDMDVKIRTITNNPSTSVGCGIEVGSYAGHITSIGYNNSLAFQIYGGNGYGEAITLNYGVNIRSAIGGYGIKTQGDIGLAVRNYADDADAPITAGAATFSGDITTSGGFLLTSSTTKIVRNSSTQIDVRADSGLRIRNNANSGSGSLFAGQGTFTGIVYFTDAQTILTRTSSGILDARVGSSFRVRDVGNTADGLITAGAGTFSGIVTFGASPTCPTSGATGAEKFGSGATASDYAVAFGNSAAAAANSAAFGYGAVTIYESTAIGRSAVAGWRGVAVGYGASTTSFYGNGDGVAIGQNAVSGHYQSIALGGYTSTTAANQLAIGAAAVPITNVRIHGNAAAVSFETDGGTVMGLDTSENVTFAANVQQGYGSTTPSARFRLTAAGQRLSEVGDGAGAWQELIAETYDAGGCKLGFYGATAVAKQTYTTGDGADALATLLHNLGLITKV